MDLYCSPMKMPYLTLFSVILAKARIHGNFLFISMVSWIPAFAGMTNQIRNNKVVSSGKSIFTNSLAFSLDPKHQIIEASTVAEAQKALSHLQKDAVIFVDVDDTLITPVAKLFRATSPYRFLIDELKQNREKYQNFEKILSHWRLQRKTMLVSQEWPKLINTLKRTYPIYALTKMETGAIGDIPSMEKWRYEELAAKGISFTSSFEGALEATLVSDSSKPFPATFYKGIFITGSFNKSDVLRAYLKNQHPTQIVLIDDRPEYLEDSRKECNRQSIPFLGILFKGMNLIEGEPDSKVAEFQKSSLFENAQWLEDEDASAQLSKQAHELMMTHG